MFVEYCDDDVVVGDSLSLDQVDVLDDFNSNHDMLAIYQLKRTNSSSTKMH